MVNRNTAYDGEKVYEATGSIQTRPRSGQPKSVRTEQKVAEVEATSIQKELNTSLCQLARDHAVSPTTMGWLVKSNLGLKALAKQKVELLNPQQREKGWHEARRLAISSKMGSRGRFLCFLTKRTSPSTSTWTAKRTGTFPSSQEMPHLNSSTFDQARPACRGVIMSHGKALPHEGSMDGSKFKENLIYKVLPCWRPCAANMDIFLHRMGHQHIAAMMCKNSWRGAWGPRGFGQGKCGPRPPTTWTSWTSACGCTLKRGPAPNPCHPWTNWRPKLRLNGTLWWSSVSRTAVPRSTAILRHALMPKAHFWKINVLVNP